VKTQTLNLLDLLNGTWILILLASILPLSCSGDILPTEAEVIQGKLDLSELNILQQQTHKLDGQWEFFWKTRPEEITDESQPHLMEVPETWINDQELGLDTFGYGTYRVSIDLPDYQGIMAIYAPVVGDSYAFYLDGQRMQQAGEPSENPDLAKPGILPRVFFFTPKNKQLVLDVFVANYNHVDPGIFLA
jgi:hypothetical protein